MVQENIDLNYKWFTINKFIVYQLTAIQMVRTPQMKKRLLEAYKTMKSDIDEELENLFHLKEIIDTINCEKPPMVLEWLLQDFGNLRVGINITSIPFIISDTPVILFSKGTRNIVFYPITPDRCILLYPYEKVDNNKIMTETLNDFGKGTFKLANLYDITQETYKREKKIRAELNPYIEKFDNENDILIFNTMIYNANEYVVSNVNIKDNNLYIDVNIE